MTWKSLINNAGVLGSADPISADLALIDHIVEQIEASADRVDRLDSSNTQGREEEKAWREREAQQRRPRRRLSTASDEAGGGNEKAPYAGLDGDTPRHPVGLFIGLLAGGPGPTWHLSKVRTALHRILQRELAVRA
ncbi:MAG TPA: hypothetical protein VFB50_05690 [Chloroflexota bacterium]|nr:hypothetical protein [Chloroflexota bacterium]